MLNLKKLLANMLEKIVEHDNIGNVYVGNSATINLTANESAYVSGSECAEVPEGTYLVIATGAFANTTTEGARRIQIYNKTADSAIFTYAGYGARWLQQEAIYTVSVVEPTIFSCRLSSSVALNNCVTGIRAIKLK